MQDSHYAIVFKFLSRYIYAIVSRYICVFEHLVIVLSFLFRELISAATQVDALSARLKKQAEQKKKEFDRGASKGRKIRYVPIPELLSFMVRVNKQIN